MGRKPSKPNAVPRLRVRKQKSGVVHYYYDHGGKPRREEPLGADYGLAIKRWAELEREANPPQIGQIITFRYISDRYLAEVAAFKAPRTFSDNQKEAKKLLAFFDDPPCPLESIEPLNVRQYMTWRTKSGRGFVRANREKALLSHMWNFAREKGYTALANPCAGVKGFKEDGRDVYVEDDEFQKVWNHADDCLRDAMDLAYLSGWRPADLRRSTEMDIRDGVLHSRQGKTRKKLRVQITPAMEQVLERIRERKRKHRVYSTFLIVNSKGRPVGKRGLSDRWKTATEKAGLAGIQFRDLRAKAGTDKAENTGDIRQAQKQLGHSTVMMTEHYVRRRRGDKVTPTK